MLCLSCFQVPGFCGSIVMGGTVLDKSFGRSDPLVAAIVSLKPLREVACSRLRMKGLLVVFGS